MLRASRCRAMRVLCLTMLPGGGGMDTALTLLGYTPYTLDVSFKQGNATTHPAEWAAVLSQRKRYDKDLFLDYDCFVGPPAAVLYDSILASCPPYTKVVLLEEPDKEAWAAEYDARMETLRVALRRTSRNKVSKMFREMLEKMVVSGAASSGAQQSAATSTRVSSSADLQRAFAQEAAATASGKHREDMSGNASETGKNTCEKKTSPPNPRAVALQKFEESVKMTVPPERLLVYRAGDGWEPLCEFLGRPVPDLPFPPLDNGLLVLGRIEDRIYRAQTFLYVVGFVTVVVTAMNILPRLGFVKDYFSDMLLDYRIAFGTDDAAALARQKSRANDADAAPSKADAFDEEWRQRGGTVKRTNV